MDNESFEQLLGLVCGKGTLMQKHRLRWGLSNSIHLPSIGPTVKKEQHWIGSFLVPKRTSSKERSEAEVLSIF